MRTDAYKARRIHSASSTASGIGDGTTGTTEPQTWNAALGSITVDGTVRWIATKSDYFIDGQAVWRHRWHSVVVFNGTVRDCYIEGFANFGIAIYGGTLNNPYTNANSWKVMNTFIGNCGGGIMAKGPDSNGGLCLGVSVNTIGYKRGGTTPIEFPKTPEEDGKLTDHPRIRSGGIGFWDNSFLGCSWVGCVAETCVGRGYFDNAVNGSSFWAGIYTESDCAPNSFYRGVGGGGATSAGISRNKQGGFVTRLGLASLGIVMDERFPDKPSGRTAYEDLPGIWIFRDKRQGDSYWGWHRGYDQLNPPEDQMWSFGYYPGGLSKVLFGVQGRDHPDGYGWRDFSGHYCGHTGPEDYFVCVLKTDEIERQPERFRHGQRRVGDRFEPPGGFIVAGKRYIGKICTTAGYEGVRWEENLDCKPKYDDQKDPKDPKNEKDMNEANKYAHGFQATTLTPSTPNGFVYQCRVRGNTGIGQAAVEPNPWPTLIGNVQFDAGTAKFVCVGPVAEYKYYGECFP